MAEEVKERVEFIFVQDLQKLRHLLAKILFYMIIAKKMRTTTKATIFPPCF